MGSKNKISNAKLKEYFKPLLKKKKLIEAVYIYGSFVTSDKPGDIDIMVVANDIEGVKKKDLNEMQSICKKITKKGKNNDLKFHFQPIKLLTDWWHSLVQGEPWLITSLQDIKVIYDDKGLIKEVHDFLDKGKLFNKEERAERLMERSERSELKNRELLLDSIQNLSNAGTEIAQILLLVDNQFSLDKEDIAKKLSKNYKEELGEEIIGNYREIIDLEEKMKKGVLSEFSGENLDYYLGKINVFIKKVETILGKRGDNDKKQAQ